MINLGPNMLPTSKHYTIEHIGMKGRTRRKLFARNHT
jgi:hypothetical protein